MAENERPREGFTRVKVLLDHPYAVEGIVPVMLKTGDEIEMEENTARGLAGLGYVEALDAKVQERAEREHELRARAKSEGIFIPTTAPSSPAMASSQAHDMMAKRGIEPHAVVDSQVTSQAGSVTQPGGPEEQKNPKSGIRTTPGSLTNPQDARTFSDVDLYPTRPATLDPQAKVEIPEQPEQGVNVTIPAEEVEDVNEAEEDGKEAMRRRRKAVKEAPENKAE